MKRRINNPLFFFYTILTKLLLLFNIYAINPKQSCSII